MATNTDLVQQLYVAYFNRPADVDGLAYYKNILDNTAAANIAATVATISADFANATEYKATYANMSAKDTINTIYHNLFGHEADIPGLNYWANLYTAGTVTLANIVTAVAGGAQGTDATAYNNKVTAAGAFTAAIATSADEMLAYAKGGDAITVARNFLSGVTDNASLTDALNNVSTAASAVVPSVTTNLTVGIDTLTGTAGNDVYNALAVDATNTAATTLNATDSIDGGAGTNTLNVTVDTTHNASIVGTFKNIQIFNIDNTTATAAAVTGTDTSIDASKLGTAAKQIWQVAKASDVTNLGASTTAGYKGTDSSTTALNVGAATGVASASIALKDVVDGSKFAVTGDTLGSVTVAGNVKSSSTGLLLDVTAGDKVQTIAVNSAVDTTLTVHDGATASKPVTTVDLSASAGNITYSSAANTVTTIKGGAGDDKLTIATATLAATSSTAATNATVDAGAGDNTITVNTTGTGATTVTTGAGDDTINVTGRGTGVLTIHMGAGSDTFTSSAPINATDVIDAGDGVDTLALELVGANNVGAFSNFDLFDAKGLDHALDTDILAQKNTVTEFTASGNAGANAELDNVAAGVGFRFTGDASDAGAFDLPIILTQKAAGALTVTVDIHETGTTAVAGTANVGGVVHATNATSVNAVFSESFVGAAQSGTDNIAELDLVTDAAASVSVTSNGGSNASNVLKIDDSANHKLATVTVTGSTALELDVSSTKLATVDASGFTGSLSFTLADITAGGNVKLGSGADLITVTAASNAGVAGASLSTIDSLTGFQKAAAASYGSDATAAKAAVAAADVLVFTGSVQADETATALGNTDVIKNGVLTFGGSGPATLTAALVAAEADLAHVTAAAGTSVAFEYLGNTYVFTTDGTSGIAATDSVVKLAGVTGVTHFAVDPNAATHFFVA